MPPSRTQITGTIVDASGDGVADVVIRLTPAAAAGPEAIGGYGVMTDPVEVLTGTDGTFTVRAVRGFTYSLDIEAIGYYESFTCPEVDSIRFDLLALQPFLEQLRDYTDADDVTYVELTVRANRIFAVRERFDILKVERATSVDGPWTELDSVDLVPGLTTYSFTDTLATGETPAESFYRARYEQSGESLDKSQWTDAMAGAARDEALLLTIDELKQIYLFGVRLTDDKGEPFPPRMFEHYIAAAVGWLERELCMHLTPQNIENEIHDHFGQDYAAWGWLQLNEYPVSAVTRVAFQYPSSGEATEYDLDSVVLQDGGAAGQIQIVPGAGIAGSTVMSGSLLPLFNGSNSRVPGIWRVDYRVGFEVGTLPADIKHLIAMRAAIGILGIAGDLIVGAGIASFSVSTPGISQSVSTTSSATMGGYGSSITEYNAEIKGLLPSVKRYYRRISLAVA